MLPDWGDLTFVTCAEFLWKKRVILSWAKPNRSPTAFFIRHAEYVGKPKHFKTRFLPSKITFFVEGREDTVYTQDRSIRHMTECENA